MAGMGDCSATLSAPARFLRLRRHGKADGPLKNERSMMSALLELPILTRTRVRSAYAIAVATDALQFALGPVGWAFADEVLDVVAAVAMWRLLGFHSLLLPTFVVEFLP